MQTHFPCALQSWSGLHCVQRPPPAPQVSSVDDTHCPLEQHPVQVVPPQLQAPLVHAWPAAHIAHSFPPEPQVVVFWLPIGMHAFPWQHPPAHEVVVHAQTPAAPQACPVSQVPH